MVSEFEIIITKDGSPTVYSPLFNSFYHSVNGATLESEHVYIKNGLNLVSKKIKELSILEIGFGTGLNTYLTLKHGASSQIYYHTIEKIPLPKNVYSHLLLDSEFQFLHECDWNKDIFINPDFILHKTKGDIKIQTLSKHYHLIYFDAFAPSNQTEMWQQSILKKLYDCLYPNGVLVTYCAQGEFKRNLKQLGFKVESLNGAAGKREMTRATKVVL